MALVSMGLLGLGGRLPGLVNTFDPPAPAPAPAPAPEGYGVIKPNLPRPFAGRETTGTKMIPGNTPPPAPPTGTAPKLTELPPTQIAPIVLPGPILPPPTVSPTPLPTWTVFGQRVTVPMVAAGLGVALVALLVLGRRSAPPASS